ncbi:MAG: PqiC family protein [Opitutaceae bacterium]|nr:PqiC family protein [Opitutaceae bacterium]
MSTTVARPVFSAALAALLLGLTGCSIFPRPEPDPTRHYVLTAPSAAPAETADVAPRADGLRLGLRTVRAASYLEGVSLIVRRGENEIDHRDFARWAEPLSVGVGRILRQRLEQAETVARVLPQPFPFDVPRDVDIDVTILRAEASQREDGRRVVSFVCAYEIIVSAEASADAGAVLARETFVAPETPWKEGDYAGLVRALGQAADPVVN